MATLDELVDLAQGKYLSAAHVAPGLAFNRAFAVASINAALHRIERAAVWTFAEATAELSSTPGERTLEMPADYAIGLMVADVETGDQLQYHDDRQGRLFEASGPPSHYSEWAGQFKLWPTPVAVRGYEVRYYSTFPDLTAPNDVPRIPTAFHELLASYAARALVLRTPPAGDRFLPNSAAEPFEMEWREGLAAMLDSPLTLKTHDSVPYLEHTAMVANGTGYFW